LERHQEQISLNVVMADIFIERNFGESEISSFELWGHFSSWWKAKLLQPRHF